MALALASVLAFALALAVDLTLAVAWALALALSPDEEMRQHICCAARVNSRMLVCNFEGAGVCVSPNSPRVSSRRLETCSNGCGGKYQRSTATQLMITTAAACSSIALAAAFPRSRPPAANVATTGSLQHFVPSRCTVNVEHLAWLRKSEIVVVVLRGGSACNFAHSDRFE